MSLTSNFDLCAQLGIDSVKQIFHLAFKSEDLYPHSVGPFTRNLSGQNVTVQVSVLDDDTDPADLSFADEKHVRFTFPFVINVAVPDSPDPSLTSVTLHAVVSVPALLTSWTESTGDVLGLDFSTVTAADVHVESLSGLPTIDVSRFAAALHSAYDTIQHVRTLGGNRLVLYDDTRDPSLTPTNAAVPADVTPDLVTSGGDQYLKVTQPIYLDVDLTPYGFSGHYTSFGRIIFHRKVTFSDTQVTVDMTVEPTGALATKVELDTASVAKSYIINAFTPLIVPELSSYGIIREPAFTDAGAKGLIASEVASYLTAPPNGVRFPVYSPQSSDPSITLSTPVGFLLVASGTLAILLNRRDSSVPDSAPDDFLGGGQLALAVGRALVDEKIAAAIAKQFPDLAGGHQHIDTTQADAELNTLSVTPSDPGTNGQSVGHLWTEGSATVHHDCWPDTHVSFEGPVFIDSTPTEDDTGCGLTLAGRAGDFDIDESCCDVLIDLLIPIVGWIMLGIIEHMINQVGGELVGKIAGEQGDILQPIPSVVNGVAEVSACLQRVDISSQGFVLPGEIHIRRLGRSFDDMKDGHRQPGP
jgi:hypothetical protein